MSLYCRICGKGFPEFDQRGFRNAGFTAHQNRCIERKQQKERGIGFSSTTRRSKASSRRPLLPAPVSDTVSTSTIFNTSPTTSPTISLNTGNNRQVNIVTDQGISHTTDCGYHDWRNFITQSTAPASSPTHLTTSPELPPPSPIPSFRSMTLPTPYELQQQQQQEQQHTAFEYMPVRYCDYCTPQAGLHDLSCTLIQFISDVRLALLSSHRQDSTMYNDIME